MALRMKLAVPWLVLAAAVLAAPARGLADEASRAAKLAELVEHVDLPYT